MKQHPSFTTFACHISLTSIIAILVSSLLMRPAEAASASEQAHLEIMLRQLKTLEDAAHRSAPTYEEPGKRYTFDYQRLTGDIARIRNGLKDYLSPTRAQPRDPVELSGSYTTEGRQP